VEDTQLLDRDDFRNDNIFYYALYNYVDRFIFVNFNIEQCTLKFYPRSPISNVDGKVWDSSRKLCIHLLFLQEWKRIIGEHKLKKIEPECTQEVLKISPMIDTVLAKLLNTSTFEQAITARYEVSRYLGDYESIN